VCFHPLRSEQLQEVLDIELGQCSSVSWKRPGPFLFRVNGAGERVFAARKAPTRDMAPASETGY